MRSREPHLHRRLLSVGARTTQWLVRAVRNDRATVTAIVACGLCVWAFAELADYVAEGEPHPVDRALLLALRAAGVPADPIGPGWVEEMVRDFTAFGGFGALAFFTLAGVGFLLLRGKRATALFLAGAVLGGIAMSLVLKSVYDRPRPDLVPHGSIVSTASFPSGHSMLSAVTYLTLGAMLSRAQPTLRLKGYVLACAVALSALVGVSRVYLGVHWPSDVVAGWAAGTVWAALVWYAAQRLEARGRLEPESGNVEGAPPPAPGPVRARGSRPPGPDAS